MNTLSNRQVVRKYEVSKYGQDIFQVNINFSSVEQFLKNHC